MRWFRFTIAGLLILVGFVAVAIAALREATDLWEHGVFTLTLGLLVVATLLAVHRAERKRAFWLGFALVGGTYLGASLVPAIESRLVTIQGWTYLDSKLAERPADLALTWRVWIGGNPNNTARFSAFAPDGQTLVASSSTPSARGFWALNGKLLAGPNGTTENFVRIGHAITTLILAFLGGQLSRALASRSQGGSS
jgi:hypothetical protein